MGIFEQTVDVLFNDDNMAADAVYVPEVGAQKTIRVMRSQPDVVDQFQRASIQSETTFFDVRVSDVDAFTKDKDKIIFGGDTYVVQSARRKDIERLIWLVDAYLEEEC